MNRKPSVASEIISHCRKCGLDLNHVVVAMFRGVPKRVLCRTCGSEHVYHPPRHESAAPTPKRSSKQPPSVRKGKSGSRSARATADPGPQSESTAERQWRSKIDGQPSGAFTAYHPRLTYTQDELVRHAKFGDGFVSRVIDAGKVEVMFRYGPRTLAQGFSGPP